MDDIAIGITKAVHAAVASQNASAVGAALNCIEPAELAGFFHETLDPGGAAAITEGLPASPGAASGEIVLNAEAAVEAADAGRNVILVRQETTPDDVVGMQVAKGVLTCRGGLVSHAAVVARGWGIPAVVGAAEVHVEDDMVTIADLCFQPGDVITVDGSTGAVYAGALATSRLDPPAELDVLLGWADEVNAGHVQVRVNADTAGDAGYGRQLGAQGIGLCRTEHMFLAADRLPAMRRFILAHDEATQVAALAELERAQEADFEALLEAMGSQPVTIRLLDPPLHEFLPDLVDLVERDASGGLTETETIELAAVRRLHESNPMLGTRGVRLGAVRPGIYETQVRALCTAVAALFKRGRRPHIEIMIPLVVDAEELRIARGWVAGVLDQIGHPEIGSDTISVGAMVETPRAAITAGALAEHADFFSFGTNDLTQMTFAFSRDDVEAKLLPAYQALGILDANPFGVLDQAGVGAILEHACKYARLAKPEIKLGVCGEHVGDPPSAAFLVRIGVDSVSCSPFRVPIARLAVAQSLLECGRVDLHDVTFTFAGQPAETEALDATAAADPATVVVDEASVLHTLKVRGFVTGDGFAASLGLVPCDTLNDLIERGLIRHLETRDMYSLMAPGQELHAEQIGTLHDAMKAALGPTYHDFLPLNDELKALCTEWQMRGPDEPNDHSDADYDAACVSRLVALVERTGAIIDRFAEALPRMRRYQGRLVEAVDAVAGGATNRFTGVMCESFHDVWMELHQDLILLQGIDRAEEGSF